MRWRIWKKFGTIRALQGIYDFVYLAILAVLSPYLLWKMVTSPKHRAGLVERLGFLPSWPNGRPRIWIHGVSVGEVLAAKSLISVLERELPNHEIVVSTTTKTGQEVAKKHYLGKRVFYYPLDFSWATRNVLRMVNPQAVILMELEIWPNFLISTWVTDVPVLLVNGRISGHSFRRYGVLQRVIPEPMDRIRLYCVQTRTYSDRFLGLGVQPDRIHITGTMKFDTIRTEGVEELRDAVRAELHLDPGERVLIAGSTHHREESILLDVFEKLSAEIPEFRLVLVPRHPERLGEVEALLHRRGKAVVRKTAIRGRLPEGAVILVDTMGELAHLYAAAEIVFVGRTLVPLGGSNMMEPAGLGRPVLFGPHVVNFRESVDILLDAGAARQVEDAAQLERVVLELARDPERAAEMGERARLTVIEHQGASRRIMGLIRPYFTES